MDGNSEFLGMLVFAGWWWWWWCWAGLGWEWEWDGMVLRVQVVI